MTLKTPHTIAVAAVALRAASRASGRQAEWPQLGIGFGVVFALGLVLVRATRWREFAHG